MYSAQFSRQIYQVRMGCEIKSCKTVNLVVTKPDSRVEIWYNGREDKVDLIYSVVE